jgi:hypothetical protein
MIDRLGDFGATIRNFNIHLVQGEEKKENRTGKYLK